MVLDPYNLIGALRRSHMLEVQHKRILVALALLVVYSTQLCRFGISKKTECLFFVLLFACLLIDFIDTHKMALCKVYCSNVM